MLPLSGHLERGRSGGRMVIGVDYGGQSLDPQRGRDCRSCDISGIDHGLSGTGPVSFTLVPPPLNPTLLRSPEQL